MNLLMITQKVDRTDDILGFTHDWIAKLAERVDHLYVLALAVGEYDLPDNVTVTSMGKDNGLGRLRVLFGFYRGLLKYLTRTEAIFVHMIPLYVLLAAPLAMLRGKPITLWYTHRSASWQLRLASRLARHIATVHPSSFPLEGPKVSALGHGINTAVFALDDKLPDSPPMIVSVARLSRIKKHETLIRAAALLRDQYKNPPARFVIAGGRPANDSPDYEDFLREEIDRLDVEDRVAMWGAIPADGMPGVFHNASIAVNFSPPGLFDKAALEGMLCGVPTIVANPAFDELLGDQADLLRISSGDDADGLAERLHHLLTMSAEERHRLGREISQRAAAAHSLDGLMDKLVRLIAE